MQGEYLTSPLNIGRKGSRPYFNSLPEEEMKDGKEKHRRSNVGHPTLNIASKRGSLTLILSHKERWAEFKRTYFSINLRAKDAVPNE